jgi:hypothetical protein
MLTDVLLSTTSSKKTGHSKLRKELLADGALIFTVPGPVQVACAFGRIDDRTGMIRIETVRAEQN